jgi:hypothetical protein
MVAWALLVVLTAVLLALVASGWVLQRVSGWVGVKVSLPYATLAAFAAGLVQTVAQLVVGVLVVVTSPLPWAEAVLADQVLFQITGGIAAIGSWLAVTMVLLDVDLGRALLIGVLNMVLSVVVSVALVLVVFNTLVVGGLAVLMGTGGGILAVPVIDAITDTASPPAFQPVEPEFQFGEPVRVYEE